MRLTRNFTFDAAHFLPRYRGKCERLHGHTYRLAVTLEGRPDEEGMLMDFAELKSLVRSAVLERLDHACLNDLLPQPSAETIAAYVFARLDPLVEGPTRRLFQVEVWETADSSAVYGREDFEAGLLLGESRP